MFERSISAKQYVSRALLTATVNGANRANGGQHTAGQCLVHEVLNSELQLKFAVAKINLLTYLSLAQFRGKRTLNKQLNMCCWHIITETQTKSSITQTKVFLYSKVNSREGT